MKIGLGTVQFGLDYGISNKKGQTLTAEVSKILDLFRDFGGNVLDTASSYGSAEEILGTYNLNEFRIISKFMPPKEVGHSIKKQLGSTLQKLNVDRIYGYLAHRPKYIIENPYKWQELIQLKEVGSIEKIGVSLNDPDELQKLINMNIIPDIIQAPFNYFDRRFESLMIDMKKKGCEIHSRSTFLQGLFFLPPEELSDYFDEVKERLIILQNNVDSLPGELLSFVVKQPFIDIVIMGVENSKQLKKNLTALKDISSLPILNTNISDRILNPSNWPKF